MNDEITYHPYRVSYLGGESHSYKHPAPLVLKITWQHENEYSCGAAKCL